MSGSELTVTAVQAAWLVHLSSNTVRSYIEKGILLAEKVHVPGKQVQWSIHLDDLANVPGVEIDPDRLQQLTVPEAAARVERRLLAIEQRVMEREHQEQLMLERLRAIEEFMRERYPALEEQIARLTETLKALERAPAAPPPPPPVALPAPTSPPTAVRVTIDTPPQSGHFPNQQERGVWLAQHGWSLTVTKQWPKELLGPREAILRYALERDARIGWRATTRNRRVGPCTDPACPCHQLFASLSRAASDEE